MSQRVRSVILHSGGLASSTLIAMATKMYDPDEIGIVVYRDLPDKRLAAATKFAEHYGIKHVIQRLPIRSLRKQSRDLVGIIETTDIALSHFPNIKSVVIGNHVKSEIKPEYGRIELWQNLISDLHNNRITLQVPFLDKNETYIVNKAVEFEIPLELARNCEADTEKFCGSCRSCRIRIHTFKQSGYIDYDYESMIDWGLSAHEQHELERYLAEEE